MKRSVIRDVFAHVHLPGFRFAASGLRYTNNNLSLRSWRLRASALRNHYQQASGVLAPAAVNCITVLFCSLDEAKRNPGCVCNYMHLPGFRFAASGLRYTNINLSLRAWRLRASALRHHYQQASGVLAPAAVNCITVQSPLFVVVSFDCGPPATAVAVNAKAFTSAESIDRT